MGILRKTLQRQVASCCVAPLVLSARARLGEPHLSGAWLPAPPLAASFCPLIPAGEGTLER